MVHRSRSPSVFAAARPMLVSRWRSIAPMGASGTPFILDWRSSAWASTLRGDEVRMPGAPTENGKGVAGRN